MTVIESIAESCKQTAEILKQYLDTAVAEITRKTDEKCSATEATMQQNTADLTGRLNNLIANDEATEGNSELVDVRKAAECMGGTVYHTAGEAVRAQAGALNAALGDKAGAFVVTESGNPLTVKADAANNKAAALVLNGKTTQAGSGDPSLTNIRAISGIGRYDKCIVLDGSERWNIYRDNLFYISNSDFIEKNPVRSSSFVGTTKNGVSLVSGECCFGDHNRLYLNSKDCVTTNDISVKLAEHPLTVWYQSTSYNTSSTYYAVTKFEDANGYHAQAVELDAPLYDDDSVDFVSGKVTRRYGRVVLTGTEDISIYQSATIISGISNALGPGPVSSAKDICNYCKIGNWLTANNSFYVESTQIVLRIDDAGDSLEDRKSYLAAQYAAGTPVTIVYELATPTETQVTPQTVPLANPTTITAENTVDCTYNKSIGSAIEELKTAIAALGTV